MLIELRIANYAVIESLSVRLERGLNVLTGETGAGKSIVVGALSLLLGERASADAIRPGADRAVVEGVFDTSHRTDLTPLLDEQGITAEDGLLILRREVALEGRNRAWINGAASTASLVGEIGRQLVDLHGQHEHQTLLRPDEQRAILDAFAGVAALAGEVAAAHERLRDAARRLDALERERRDVEQRAELLRQQAAEIERAGIRPGEEDMLEAEAGRLTHGAELARLASSLHQLLYQADDAVTARLDEARRLLDRLLRIDPAEANVREPLEGAYYTIEELGRRMGEYAAGIDNEPGRLDDLRRRQDLLFRLKHRYGPTLEDVIAAGVRARNDLDLLDRAGFERQRIEREHDDASAEYARLCRRLTAERRNAAMRLAAEVTSTLPELGMDGGRFEVDLSALEAPGAYGAERIAFRVAINAGFEPRELARVASGGELSRVMLALKAILARVDRVPTLVFDEIDAGVGGRVAHDLAIKLHQVAETHQVFVITHLPQIASRADHHLLVEKEEADGHAATHVVELEGSTRVRELARMLGGDPESSASLEHAREMLGAAG